MMGARSKKKGYKTLTILKRAGVIIAIFDLILTISDCRNVGRFFLLVTMSNTFDITPENVLGDHCQTPGNLRRGVCETWSQMMETGSPLAFSASEMAGRSFHPHVSSVHNNAAGGGGGGADMEGGSSYLKATLSIQRLPEMLKELVMSWKSTFDPSRTDRNISFYFDDDEVPRMHEQQLPPQGAPPPPVKHQHRQTEGSWHTQTSSLSSSVPSSLLDNNRQKKHASPSLPPPREAKNIPSLNQRKNSPGESHEYDVDSIHLNSHVGRGGGEIEPDFITGVESPHVPSSFHHDHTTTIPQPRNNDVTGRTDDTDDISKPLHFSKNNQEIGFSRKKRFAAQQPPSLLQQPLQSQNKNSQDEEESSSTAVQSKIAMQPATRMTFTSMMRENEEQDFVETTATTSSPLEKATLSEKRAKVSSNSEPNFYSPNFVGDQGNDHLKPSKSEGGGGGKRNGSNRATSNLFTGWMGPKEKAEGEKCSQPPGPKKMMGFLEQEMFSQSRWQSLLQTAQALINPRASGGKLCIGEQLGSVEAGSIKMHIELKPFGPHPFKEAERRLKATQQILFDSPWLSMIQLYSKLSGGFIKIFVVITAYTWIWGTILGLILLIGSLTEEAVLIHGWIVFNILYSLLFFMIDDWIHSNINPCRTTVSMWLSISYSLYKPLATWLVLMQWSELKKLVSSPDPNIGDGNCSSNSTTTSTSSQCLDKTTMKFVTPHPSSTSYTSLSSDTTKESTIVDLNITDIGSQPVEKESNTSAALILAASKLRLGSCDHHLQSTNNRDDYDDDYEEDEEDEDLEYEEDYDEESDDDEGDERRDLERGGGESEGKNTTTTATANNKLNVAGERGNDNNTDKNNHPIVIRGRNNGYIVTH